MSQRPSGRRYVTRVFGVYSSGIYRGVYVQRIPLSDYMPPEHDRATITPGAGSISLSGKTATTTLGTAAVPEGLRPTKPLYVTRVFTGSYNGGVYRGSYIQRIPLYYPPVVNAQGATTSVGVGDGSITVQGSSVTLDKFVAIAAGVGTVSLAGAEVTVASGTTNVSAGSGSVTVQGAAPAFQKSLPMGAGSVVVSGKTPTTFTGIIPAGLGRITVIGGGATVALQESIGRENIRTTVKMIPLHIGTGVYRRTIYRVYRRFEYYTSVILDKRIFVGAGSVTVQGADPALDPNQRIVGAGAVSVQGRPPSILADNAPVSALPPGVIAAINRVRRHRKLLARWAKAYIPVQPDITFVDYVEQDPQRIIGVSGTTISVAGSQPSLTKRISAGVGNISVQGLNPILDTTSILVGSTTITVQGLPVILDGDIITTRLPGAGSITVQGLNPIASYDGVVAVAPGAGEVTVQGEAPTVQDEKTVSVGAGSVTIQGSGVVTSVDVGVGAGSITVQGSAVTVINQQVLIEVLSGEIFVIGNRIGLSTPEKASSPSAGVVSIVGSLPNVIATGYWEQTAGSSLSWDQTAGSSLSWGKVANGDSDWNKI